MTLIISKNGQGAQRLEPSNFGNEDYLQQYIHDNPEVVPVNEIDSSIRLVVLAREFNTDSGPIDALGIDQRGNIYLIETKLYNNSDRRHVVAQVLDYGAALWSSSPDFADFKVQLDKHVQEKFGVPLPDKLKDCFALDDDGVEELMANVQANLNSGTFKFVVPMDRLHQRLKDMIVFLNRSSQFNVYAVELDYYKHDIHEIIIPRLFGAEVKKDATSAKPSSGSRRKWDEASYWQEVDANLDAQNVQALRKLYEWAVKSADNISWGTGASRGSFNPQFLHICSNSFISAYTDGSIKVNYGYLGDDALRIPLRNSLHKHLALPGVTDPEDGALNTSRTIPPEYAQRHMDKIIEALTEFINR